MSSYQGNETRVVSSFDDIYIEREDGKLSDELFIPLKVAGLVYAAVYLGVLLSSEGEIAEMALIPSGQMGIWHTKKGPDQIGSFVGMEMTGRIHRHLPK